MNDAQFVQFSPSVSVPFM